MRISEVARRTGVPATTLRYYESVGLIESSRGVNGYRDYDEDVLEHLAFINGAKQLHLLLTEIADLLDVVNADSCTQVRETLRPKLTDRLREIDERLRILHYLRDRLGEANQHVTDCPDNGQQCRAECVVTSTASAPANRMPNL